MSFDFLSLMAYLIVFLTLLTMIFGVVAYMAYKKREKRRAQKSSFPKVSTDTDSSKHLFFKEESIKI
jgi:predicted membrane protein